MCVRKFYSFEWSSFIFIPPNNLKLRKNLQESIKIGTPLFLNGILQTNKLVESYGGKYFIFLQPNIYSKLHPSKNEAKAIELYDYMRPLLGGIKAGNYLRKNNIYSEFIKTAKINSEINLKIFDFYNLFENDKDEVFYSIVHCNDLGYRKISLKIFKEIKEYINVWNLHKYKKEFPMKILINIINKFKSLFKPKTKKRKIKKGANDDIYPLY